MSKLVRLNILFIMIVILLASPLVMSLSTRLWQGLPDVSGLPDESILLTVYGAEGDGSGDGSGTNRRVALTLTSSSVKDGSTNIPIDSTIQLNFNKNVCNITVLPNNKKCFHLTDVDGNAVPIKLTFPDDQVQHDYRREVFITPLDDLAKNTEYRISVDSTLMAKNGTYIDNAHILTFTTGEESKGETNAILKKLGDFTVVYETALSETEDSVPINKELLSSEKDDNSISTDSISHIVIAAIVLIILIFSFFIIFKIRKSKS